jgi:methionyl-tRNA synthetase
MTKFKRHTVTAALPYANGPLHIGHIAGAYLPADTYVRFLRLRGEDVVFICGSDEHGVAITLGAKKEGVTPQAFVDKYHTLMKKAFDDFGVSFDIYSRTSNPVHYKTAQEFFKKIYDQGLLLEETSDQYYDEQEKIFLADR